jgi:hypothetical protein
VRIAAVALLVVTGGCLGLPHPQDVEREFKLEYRTLRLRVPVPDDPDAGAATGAPHVMQRTVALSERYLRAYTSESTARRYVRSLLATALLLQGESERAHHAIADIPHDQANLLSRQNRVIQATRHAASAYLALRARLRFEDFLDGRIDGQEFLANYAGLVGIDLPERASPLYDPELHDHAIAFERSCRMEIEGDPRELERVSSHRRRYRAMLAEQIYNDAAALLVALPPLDGEEWEIDEWYGVTVANLFSTCSIYVDDLLPHEINEEQKQWQREHAFSAFQRVKTAAAIRFLPEEVRLRLDEERPVTPIPVRNRADYHRRVYQRLLYAENDVLDHISFR